MTQAMPEVAMIRPVERHWRRLNIRLLSLRLPRRRPLGPPNGDCRPVVSPQRLKFPSAVLPVKAAEGRIGIERGLFYLVDRVEKGRSLVQRCRDRPAPECNC